MIFRTSAAGCKSKQQFHIDHVEPAVEFEADLFEVRHLDETERSVQPDAGLVLRINAREDRVKPALSRGFDERLHQ